MIFSKPTEDTPLFDALIDAGVISLDRFNSFDAPESGRIFPVLVANADRIDNELWLQFLWRRHQLGRYPSPFPEMIESGEITDTDALIEFEEHGYYPIARVGQLQSLVIGIADPRALPVAKAKDWSDYADHVQYFGIGLAETRPFQQSTLKQIKLRRGF